METDSEYLKPQNRTKYVVYLFRRVTATLLANTGVYVLQLNRRGLEVFHCRRKLRRMLHPKQIAVCSKNSSR